jgi:DNA polymerase III delta prime subunit
MAEVLYTKWHRELDIFHKIKSVIILEGNIMDSYQYPEDGSIVGLTEYLHLYLKAQGYEVIVGYNGVQGFFQPENDTQILEQFGALSGCTGKVKDGFLRAPFYGSGETAPLLIRQAVQQEERQTAVIMSMASRYIPSPEHMSQQEVDSFTTLQLAADQSAEGNLLLLLVNKTNDLPAWFCLDNPNVKILYLSTPSAEERTVLIRENFRSFFDREIYNEQIGYYEEHPRELEKLQERFIGLTEGFTFREINDLRRLSKNEKCPIAKMADIIDLYRYGPKENPWSRKDLREVLRNGQERIHTRVKGQDLVVEKALDVVKRAAAGMSGLQHSSHTKPKGILFFAGPTGTGKTELAKTLAEMLFGEENRCLRFDMSEYSQPQSDQKLLGAPPGYVGYEAGGQLTNAIRENPFSILLFDEIEKAHASIFDKFLQILEDGRMTDGQGKTVYFSESILIFTSNLGIYTTDEYGNKHLNVSSEDTYAKVEQSVRRAIEDYFKLTLGRPEILNRIGENILVFDFIRPKVAAEILDAQIEKIIANLGSEKNIVLTVEEPARQKLQAKAFENLDNGGRGIGNVVEKVLINPLARYLFDNELLSDATLTIHDLIMEEGRIQLDVRNGEER